MRQARRRNAIPEIVGEVTGVGAGSIVINRYSRDDEDIVRDVGIYTPRDDIDVVGQPQLHIHRVVVDLTILRRDTPKTRSIRIPGIATQPDQFSCLSRSGSPSVVDADVVAINDVVRIAEYLDKTALVVITQVVLHDDIGAVVVHMHAAGIDVAVGVFELVVLDDHILAIPRPISTPV